MANPEIEKIAKSIPQKDKNDILSSLQGMGLHDIKSKVESIDLNAVSDIMRRLNLGDAAAKLDSMSQEEIVSSIAKNPQIIDKLKSILK